MRKSVKKKRNTGVARRSAMLGYLFTSHWLVGLLLFTIFPLLYSMYMSFHKVIITTGIETSYVNVQNFIYAFSLDVRFVTALIEALMFVGVITPLIIILSLIIGLLLSRPIRLKGLFRAIFFFPVVIISGTLYSLLEQNQVFAIINFTESQAMRWLSSAGFGIFAEVVDFLVNNIFTVLWFSGVQILIYLSGLQKTNPSVYEASSIDGASSWQTFWKITLPLMNQFTIINIIYTVVLLSTFSTNTVIMHIRSVMFGVQSQQFHGLGYASALAWIYFAITVVVLLIFVGLVSLRPKKRGDWR